MRENEETPVLIGMKFGDGSTYKKKGDRCSCKCHDPTNKLPCCKKCRDEGWPGELDALEEYYGISL